MNTQWIYLSALRMDLSVSREMTQRRHQADAGVGSTTRFRPRVDPVVGPAPHASREL